MRRTLTLAVLALTFISTRSLPQQSPTTGSIEGIVVRSDNGEPIAGAQVQLNGILSAAEIAAGPVLTNAPQNVAPPVISALWPPLATTRL